jgi:hypothetical protein
MDGHVMIMKRIVDVSPPLSAVPGDLWMPTL